MSSDQVKTIAEKYSTPCYIFDIDVLKDRVDSIRKHLGKEIGLCFAIKANPFVVSEVSAITDRVEVCSPGEFITCMEKKIPPEKIFLSGVNKEHDDVLKALNYGVRNVTAESPRQMNLINDIAGDLNIKVNVFPRLTSGSQFGMDELELNDIIANLDKYPNCTISGIHYFVGTQRKHSNQQKKDIEKLLIYLDFIEKNYGFHPSEIEYGPGLYFPYFEDEEDDNYQQLADLNEEIRILSERHGVTVELGRYLAASCGTYLTKVADVKKNKGINYAILDGGINHLNYYGGMMGLKVPRFTHISGENNSEGEKQEWTLCGSLCTTNDILIRSVMLNDLKVGDMFAFENVGAYSSTESIGLFLSRKLPQIIKTENNDIKLVRDFLSTSQINQ